MVRRVLFLASLIALSGCDKPKRYSANVEIARVQRFGQDPKAAVMDIELRYSDCPGDARRLIRTEKSFASCGGALKAGDHVSAELVATWNAERGSYRSDILSLAGCPVHLDPKEEANYETYQSCSDLVATGSVVGVTCDRSRGPELVAKCPWLRRK